MVVVVLCCSTQPAKQTVVFSRVSFSPTQMFPNPAQKHLESVICNSLPGTMLAAPFFSFSFLLLPRLDGLMYVTFFFIYTRSITLARRSPTVCNRDPKNNVRRARHL